VPEVREEAVSSDFDDFEKFHREQMEDAFADSTDDQPARVAEESPGLSFEEFMRGEEPVAESGEGGLSEEELFPQGFGQPEEPSEERPPAAEEPGAAMDEGSATVSEEPSGVSFEEFMREEEPVAESGEGGLSEEEPFPQGFGQPEEPSEERPPAAEEPGAAMDEESATVSEEPSGISFEDLISQETPSPGFEESESPAEGTIPEEFDLPGEPPQEEVDSEGVDQQVPPASEMVTRPEETPAEEAETALSMEAFLKGEIERESKDQAKGAALPSLKQKKFEDLLKGKRPKTRLARRSPSLRTILLLILLVVIGALAYLGWQNQEVSMSLLTHVGPTLETAVGKVSGLWEDVIGFRKEDLELSGLQGYEDMIGQHRIYIIRGDVRNKSKRARKYVKLKIVILDQTGNRLREKVIYCGNVFTREELQKLAPAFLTGGEALQPKRPKDMVLEPNRALSFMAIFSGLPREGKSFKVEKLEAPAI